MFEFLSQLERTILNFFFYKNIFFSVEFSRRLSIVAAPKNIREFFVTSFNEPHKPT